MQQPQTMPQQQQPLPKKRKQAGGASVPVAHMQPGLPGVNSPNTQGMHPAMAQQLVMKNVPEAVDPTIAEMDELSARDIAVARYRRRHGWMNEIFNAVSLADMPPLPNPYEYLHAKALEDQVVQLERQADDVQRQGQRRLEEAKARFAELEQEATDQQASMQLDP
ncbi:hypothetical protein NCC49_002701 [Naganishia albida]|nr:hypothetical protein NCC49_002701 [Naganishia albida]